MSFVNLDPSDIVVSAESITAPAWSNNNPVLTRFTSASSVAPNFYVDVYLSGGISPTPEFSIAYGNVNGGGSLRYNQLVSVASPTRTIYGQYRTLVYGDENSNFNFGTGNASSTDMIVININRDRYKQQLYTPTFNLTLKSGSATLNLSTNINNITTVPYLDCGRAFDIVSGSNGTVTTATPLPTGAPAPGYTRSGSYGLFLPDVGLVVLNPRALALTQGEGGILLNVNQTENTNALNYQAVYNAVSGGAYFSLNSEETISSDYIFVRVKSQDFNYTTNPSVISGSGALNFPSMINNPQTFMTTVGMYNINNELLAVAKLSKPLVKDFTKEALIKVKLNW